LQTKASCRSSLWGPNMAPLIGCSAYQQVAEFLLRRSGCQSGRRASEGGGAGRWRVLGRGDRRTAKRRRGGRDCSWRQTGALRYIRAGGGRREAQAISSLDRQGGSGVASRTGRLRSSKRRRAPEVLDLPPRSVAAAIRRAGEPISRRHLDRILVF